MATDFDPRFDPAFQRGYEPERVEPVEGSRGKHHVNPWLIVLWALAAVLFVAGIAGLIATQEVSNTANELTAVVYPAVVRALSPWAAGGGLVGIVMAVFVQALQWRRP